MEKRQQKIAFEPLSSEALLFSSCKMLSGEIYLSVKFSLCIRPLLCNGQESWAVDSGMFVKTIVSLVSAIKVIPWHVLLNPPVYKT